MAERSTVGDHLAASCSSVIQASKAAQAIGEARVLVAMALKGVPRAATIDDELHALERKFWARCAELENELDSKRKADDR